MKRIIIIMSLLCLLLSGCSNKVEGKINILQCMEKVNYSKTDIISILGEPDGRENTDLIESYTWNNYELFDGYKGVLSLNYCPQNIYIDHDWAWKIIGDDKLYDKIYSILAKKFGKEAGKPANFEKMGKTLAFKTDKEFHNISLGYNGEVITVCWELPTPDSEEETK